MSRAAEVIRIAASQIGYSRWDDPLPGTKYGRWYEQEIDRCSTNYDFGASGVPFCAMGVSWTFNEASATCAGVPGAYCPSMLAAAISRGKKVYTGNAQPGDVVYFDWNGNGEADHVGIVEINHGTYLQTIEYNTDNGRVARRTRAYSTVCGVVRPDWESVLATPPTDAPAQPVAAGNAIAAVQEWLNANYGTGIAVDNQYGPQTKRALTIALQTELNRQYNKGLEVDGSFGPKTKAACVNLYRGANGNITRTLQGCLIGNGYSTGGFDGDFGGVTYASLKSYQATHGLEVDGVAGKMTFSSLLG